MKNATVLIVEDSDYLAESVKDILEMHGHNVLLAPTGEIGISLALNEHPDITLLDIRLPDMSGYDVYQAIRKDDWGATAKLSVLTASESLENIAKNISLPVEYVLFKPEQSLRDLVTHIENRLQEN